MTAFAYGAGLDPRPIALTLVPPQPTAYVVQPLSTLSPKPVSILMAIAPLLLHYTLCIAAIFQKHVDKHNLSFVDGELTTKLDFSGA